METPQVASPVVLKAEDLVQSIKQRKPGIFKGIDDAKATRLVREVAKQLGQNLAAVVEGDLRIRGLGRFRVRQIEREKYGVVEKVRRVAFTALKPKTKV